MKTIFGGGDRAVTETGVQRRGHRVLAVSTGHSCFACRRRLASLHDRSVHTTVPKALAWHRPTMFRQPRGVCSLPPHSAFLILLTNSILVPGVGTCAEFFFCFWWAWTREPQVGVLTSPCMWFLFSVRAQHTATTPSDRVCKKRHPFPRTPPPAPPPAPHVMLWLGVSRVIKCCQEAGVESLVFTSSSRVALASSEPPLDHVAGEESLPQAMHEGGATLRAVAAAETEVLEARRARRSFVCFVDFDHAAERPPSNAAPPGHCYLLLYDVGTVSEVGQYSGRACSCPTSTCDITTLTRGGSKRLLAWLLSRANTNVLEMFLLADSRRRGPVNSR